MLTVLYFASLRETLGCSREQVPVPSGATTVGLLVEQLRNREGPWSESFAPGRSWRVAVNQRMADASTPLKVGDEVAFFPPVTGG